MFDARFNKGIVFRIDTDAAKEFKLTEGTDFAISRDATAVEIRASRFKDGKPARGRPRKFPTVAVARMLGITDLPASAPLQAMVEDSDENDGDSSKDEARVSSLIAGTTPAATPAVASEDANPW